MLAEHNGQDFLGKIISLNSNDVPELHCRSSRPAWNPNVSVLELAYKLKEAERSVFGHSFGHRGNQSNSQTFPVTSEAGQCGHASTSTGTAIKPEPMDDMEFNGSSTLQNKAYDRVMLNSFLHNNSRTQLPISSLHSDSFPAGLDRNVISGSADRVLGGLGDAFMQVDSMHQFVLGELQTARELTPPPARHHCQQCAYTTNNLHHMRRHCATMHTEMKPYQCYVCNQEFNRSEKVREHFISFHPDIAYDAKLVRKFSLAPGEGSKDYPPPGDIKTRIRALFQDVEGTDMEYEKDKDRPFGCLRCSYATRDLWHLRRHVFDVHKARKQHNCRICRYATNRSLRLQAHMRGHGEMFCEYCDDFSTLQPEYFSLHDKLCGALAAVNAAGFRCRACGSDCGDQSHLRSHSIEQHTIALAACDECPFYAYTSDEFLTHVEVHEAISRTCGLCGLTFGTRVERDQHDILAHLISRPSADGRDLACGVCGEVSEPRGSLEPAILHVRRHVPDKVACKEANCKFKAILPESLEMHARYYHATGAPTTTEPGPLPARPKVDSVTLSNMALPKDKTADKTPYRMSPSLTFSTPTTSLVGTFACTICGPKRTPFKYWRSYEKHMAQHSLEAAAGRQFPIFQMPPGTF